MNILPPLVSEAAISNVQPETEDQPPNARNGWELLKTAF
jgi:hypothetical protein